MGQPICTTSYVFHVHACVMHHVGDAGLNKKLVPYLNTEDLLPSFMVHGPGKKGELSDAQKWRSCNVPLCSRASRMKKGVSLSLAGHTCEIPRDSVQPLAYHSASLKGLCFDGSGGSSSTG